MQTVSRRRAAIKVSWVKLAICMHEVYTERDTSDRDSNRRVRARQTVFFSPLKRNDQIVQAEGYRRWLISLGGQSAVRK